jgi:hypothetical protein
MINVGLDYVSVSLSAGRHVVHESIIYTLCTAQDWTIYHHLPKEYLGTAFDTQYTWWMNIPWIHCELSRPTVCGLVLIAIERGKLKLWQARIGGVVLSLLQVIPATWNRATLDLQSILPYLSLYYQRMQLYTRTLLKLLLCALADWYLQFSIDHLHEDWWGWAATTHTLNYTAFIN